MSITTTTMLAQQIASTRNRRRWLSSGTRISHRWALVMIDSEFSVTDLDARI
jgi:hypothetical protein